MPKRSTSEDKSIDPRQHARRLLAWYDRHRRELPWRAPPGVGADPYRVWLSEIMLQQTTVGAVRDYFRRFLERWPTVESLAAAPVEDVLAAWAGLGYYARARNLHRCAQHVVQQRGGVFPDQEAALAELPGVGPYTAAAIAAIAFDRPTSAVDGNVERVVARLFAVEEAMPRSKPRLRALAAGLVPQRRAGDYAQAMMDLGAGICTPREPACILCPIAEACVGRARGIAGELPRRSAKPERPTRRGLAFLLQRGDGAILLRRRPPRGLLGGMLEVPSSEWRTGAIDTQAALAEAPLSATWRLVPGTVEHTFTHFHLVLAVARGRRRGAAVPAAMPDAEWFLPDRLQDLALPSVMRKTIAHGLGLHETSRAHRKASA